MEQPSHHTNTDDEDDDIVFDGIFPASRYNGDGNLTCLKEEDITTDNYLEVAAVIPFDTEWDDPDDINTTGASCSSSDEDPNIPSTSSGHKRKCADFDRTIHTNIKKSIVDVFESDDDNDVTIIDTSINSNMDRSGSDYVTPETSLCEGSHPEAELTKPVAIFPGRGHIALGDTMTDSALGPCYKLDHLYHCFQTTESDASVLAWLCNPDVLAAYGTHRIPQCFQGRAWFAVTFQPEQRERIFGLILDDGNGHWRESNERFGTGRRHDDDGTPFMFLKKDWYSRPDGKSNGFRRKLLAVVASEEDRNVPLEDFLVIQYMWSSESKITPFSPGRTYTNRAVTGALRKLASPVARGKPMSPRDMVLEVASAIPDIDREVNPFYGPKNLRQAMSIRTSVNKKVYGEDTESYLRRKEGVILRQYQNENGSKSENFILVDPYHVGLIATNGDQKLNYKLRMQIDVTFKLCNMFVVVIVIQHPYCVNDKTGKPALMIGPTCLTQRKTKASFLVFANYVRECLTGVGVDVASEAFSFDFITDGERALYEAFRETFPRHNHTLCVLHLRDGIERYFHGKAFPSSHVTFVKNTVFGYHRIVDGAKKHVLGLVDSESEAQYYERWARVKSSLGDEKFRQWFEKTHQKNFLQKLILPAREAMGLSRDLPNTNLSEAMNKTLKAFFGTHNDPREVVERLLKMYADETVFMFQAMRDQGRYKIAEPHKKTLLLSRERAHDKDDVLSKLRQMFPKSDVNAIVVVASSRLVEAPVSLSTNVLPEFASTGIADMFRSSWDKAREYFASREDKEWMAELSPDEVWLKKRKWNSSILRKVSSADNRKHCWYFVEIRGTTGEGKCSCLQFVGNKDPACKHIIAVAAATGHTDRLIEWLKLDKNLRPFGSWLLRSAGGDKPGRKKKNLSGSGYTSRRHNDAVEMSFDEEGYCYKGEGCKTGKPWRDSTFKFIVKKHPNPSMGYQCPGCRILFAEKPATFDILVSHVEQDFQNDGGGVISLPRVRLYHMDNRCIKIRHPKFDSSKDVVRDKTIGSLVEVEDAAVRKFCLGYVV